MTLLLNVCAASNFNLNINNSEDMQRYYQNAKADAIHCYKRIEKYLSKDKKILEVGGYSFAYELFAPRL